MGVGLLFCYLLMNVSARSIFMVLVGIVMPPIGVVILSFSSVTDYFVWGLHV